MDGDTDVPSVQQDFAAALYQLMRRARRKEETSRDPDSSVIKGHPNGIHASNKRAIPNGNAKPTVNGVSNHAGKTAHTMKNGIAQGIIVIIVLAWHIKSIFFIPRLSTLNSSQFKINCFSLN